MAGDNIATDEDMMQCTLHTTIPGGSGGGGGGGGGGSGGGICAYCLQDKLGKLVSNSSKITFLPNSNSPSSSTSSFRSRLPTASASVSSSVTSSDTAFRFRSDNPPLSLLSNKFKSRSNHAFALSRSKSTTDYNNINNNIFNQNDYSTTSGKGSRRKGFWSFLHFPYKKTPTPTPPLGPGTGQGQGPTVSSVQLVVVEEETEPIPNSKDNVNGNNDNERMCFDRKVTRSRSVGCGSRSFSGDIFDRISTGFGDCALRRVESHRHSTSTVMREREREKPRCGGLFGGFMMIASSSSSTSTTTTSTASSSYWPSDRPLGRTKGWGWALASPRRVFGAKNVGIANKEIDNGESSTRIISNNAGNANASDNSKKTSTTNLDDIPSLLSVRN